MSNSLCSLIIFCSPSRNCRPSCTIPRFSEYYYIITYINHHTLAMSLHALLLSCSPSRNRSPSFSELFNILKISLSALLLSCSPGRNFKLLHLILSIRGTTILQSATRLGEQCGQTKLSNPRTC